jgi:Mrp family chromosome partitioning ATPase
VGEIADALRRARESRVDQSDAPTKPSEVGTELRPGQLSRDLRPADPAGGDNAAQARQDAREPRTRASACPHAPQTVESLEPTSPAIVWQGTPGGEQCRRLAIRLREEMERVGATTTAIVSAVRGEGKTTAVCDLGLAMAALSRDRDVAVVDLDLRRPSVARALGVEPKVGLEEVLRGSALLAEARIAVQSPPLDLYAMVTAQESTHDLLVSHRFETIMAELASGYRVVLIDTPPVLVVPDVSIMLRHIAGCVPIARSGVTRPREFKQLTDALPRDKVIGQVFNGARLASYSTYAYSDETEPASGDAGETRRPDTNKRRSLALRRRAS